MIMVALTGVLVLVVGGCVCVVWAARGGPRWVRGVAAVTLAPIGTRPSARQASSSAARTTDCMRLSRSTGMET
ncbi:hypothetical protein ACWCPG_12650, partial [Streptomyces sp. NPDC001919]